MFKSVIGRAADYLSREGIMGAGGHAGLPDIERSTSAGRMEKRRKYAAKFEAKLRKYGLNPQEYASLLSAEMFPDKKDIYDTRSFPVSHFLTDLEREMTHTINGSYRVLLRDKYLSYQLLSGYVRVPSILLLAMDGHVEFRSPAYNRLVNALSGEASVFIKPIKSAGGKGASSTVVRGGHVSTPDGEVPFGAYLDALIREHGDLMVSETLRQSRFMQDLYPHSINTVRLVTARSPSTREVFAAHGVVRVGNDLSRPVDNYSSGGFSYALDIASGEIGSGRNKAGIGPIPHHIDAPENRIAGRTLPDFDRIVKTALDAHRALPYINYVGWDLCIADDGITVVEANNTSDVDLLQMHRPLLTDPRMVEFYRHHDIL